MPLDYQDWLREARGKAYLTEATVRRLETDWPEPNEWQREQIALAKEAARVAANAVTALLVHAEVPASR